MTPADIENLRSSVAKDHKVLLNHDDPIFVSVHLNELMLTKMLGDMKGLVADARNDSIAAVAHQVDVAKAVAAKLINETAQFVADEVHAQMRSAIDSSVAAASQAARFSQRASWVALGAAAVGLVITGAAGGAVLAILLKH